MSSGAGIYSERDHEAATLSLSPLHSVGGGLERDNVPFSRRCHVTGLSTSRGMLPKGTPLTEKRFETLAYTPSILLPRIRHRFYFPDSILDRNGT